MKKLILIAVMASGLVACAQSPAPKEDSRLKEAYSACIITAQGSPEKIEACQSVLNVLKKKSSISSLLMKKAYAYWIISSASRLRAPEMVSPLMLIATRSGRKFVARILRSKSKNETDNGRRVFRPFAFQGLYSTG